MVDISHEDWGIKMPTGGSSSVVLGVGLISGSKVMMSGKSALYHIVARTRRAPG